LRPFLFVEVETLLFFLPSIPGGWRGRCGFAGWGSSLESIGCLGPFFPRRKITVESGSILCFFSLHNMRRCRCFPFPPHSCAERWACVTSRADHLFSFPLCEELRGIGTPPPFFFLWRGAGSPRTSKPSHQSPSLPFPPPFPLPFTKAHRLRQLDGHPLLLAETLDAGHLPPLFCD